jgi:hypothetical protein
MLMGIRRRQGLEVAARGCMTGINLRGATPGVKTDAGAVSPINHTMWRSGGAFSSPRCT